ncbi:MAG: hypothetical protein H7Y02_04005 [Candidatus Obscuribacterales bacterium]|nr:hypothetical protein [Steroidobacteraceae bacterium]
MVVNLNSGDYTAELNQLVVGEIYSVWLVDREVAGATNVDKAIRIKLATLRATAPSLTMTSSLGSGLPTDLPATFAIDRVEIRGGPNDTDELLASGSVSVFQKLFLHDVIPVTNPGGKARLVSSAAPLRFAPLVPDLLSASKHAPSARAAPNAASSADPLADASTTAQPLDNLIKKGAKDFFENTFSGNGRTCGTCHPSSNNFTIDPAFIATLPNNDPLFVAEFNAALAQLERPQLMRQFGLILENLDGFADPANKFVMRSVPHTLGLQVTLTPDAATPNTPVAMTGWGGDGSPGTGSLREFAIGAVTQHFTKRLDRVAGTDFRLPTENELDGMEAFQLSLGRTADFNLANITFLDASVDSGRNLFVNGTGSPSAGGRCNNCHSNGGATAAVGGQNRNFNTNVEDVVHPARSILAFPHDGGFGQNTNPDNTFGNRTFNTPPVIEAADTGAFFHANTANTLEDIVAFYSGPEFNTPRAATARFSFDATQSAAIANFMRGINTLQNIDVAQRELEEILALNGNPKPEIDIRLQTALFDARDAINVLSAANLFPSAVTALNSARQLIMQAQQTSNPNTRRTIIQQAIVQLSSARNLVATIS